jgi:hypothetical protein
LTVLQDVPPAQSNVFSSQSFTARAGSAHVPSGAHAAFSNVTVGGQAFGSMTFSDAQHARPVHCVDPTQATSNGSVAGQSSGQVDPPSTGEQQWPPAAGEHI